MKNKFVAQLIHATPYFALALLIALIVGQANPLTTLPSRDNGSYLYTGQLILRGELPYVNVWDSKPPAIFYLNALGLWIGRNTSWGVWFLEFVFLFAAAVIGYRLLRKVWQPGPAIFGMIFWLWGLDVLIAKGDVIEEYSLPFNIAIIFLFWLGYQNQKNRIYDFLIGLFTVFSFLFRANNIGPGIAVAICWILIGIGQKKPGLLLKRLGTMMVGAGLALGCVAAFLWRQGILAAAWNAAIMYNFSYIKTHTSILSSIVPGFRYLGLVAWVALLGYGAAVSSVIRWLKTRTMDAFVLLLVVLWPVEIILSSLSGRNYIHYFVNWLPAIAVLCGYAYFVFSSTIFTRKVISFLNTEKIPLTLVVLVFILVHFNRLIEYKDTFYTLLFNRAQGVEIINSVSKYIRRNTKPGDTVLDWGQSGINYMARRDSPTPFIWYPLYLPSRITPALENGFYQDITSNPPEIIVDAYLVAPDDVLSLDQGIRNGQLELGKGLGAGKASNLDRVFEFIQGHYKVETIIDNYTVFRLIRP